VRRLNKETTGHLMGQGPAISMGHPGAPNNVQRFKLHSYRFVTAWRAPIPLAEKIRVWLYLLRRVIWLRHRAFNKLRSIVGLRR
jgi:hypothetical protein